MNTPDPKKLIAGFLVLAAIASSLSLGLSGYLTVRANKNEAKTEETPALKNAFSKEKPKDLNIVPGQNKGNLTASLADGIALSILEANQNGPRLDAIELPNNIESILDQEISSYELSEDEFLVDDKKIKTIDNPSAKDYEDYFKSLESIFKEYSEGENFNSIKRSLQNSSDSEMLGAANLLYSEASVKLYALKVPKEALPFHKSVLKSLNVPIKVLGSANSDPLKSFALFQASEPLIDEYLAQTIKEFNVLSIELEKVSWNEGRSFSLINTAHAFFSITFDPTNFIENLLTQIAEWMRIPWEYQDYFNKIMIAIIKEQLLNRIVNAILNWAGVDIVGNWQNYLGKTFGAVAGQYLNQAAQELCTDYRNSLVKKLQTSTGAKPSITFDSVAGESGFNTGCPLESVVPDVQAFFDDFSIGGWDGYMALAMPSGNYYGSLFSTSQDVVAKAEEAKEARKAELLAGGGSAPTEICENGDSPKNGVCEDGSDPEVTTQGQTKTELVSKGLGSVIDRIVNANAEEWTDLAAAVANAAINKLFTSGNKGVKRGNLSGSQAADPYAACYGYKKGSTEYINCIKNVDESNSHSNSNAQALIDEAKTSLSQVSSTLSAVILSIETVSSTIAILVEVQNSCPANAEAAEAEAASLNQEYIELLSQADPLITQISDLQAFIEEVSAHDPKDSDYFRKKRIEFDQKFNRAKIAKVLAEAQGNLARYQQKMEDALAALSCETQ